MARPDTADDDEHLRSVPVHRARGGQLAGADVDRVAHEEPLEIQVNGASVAVVMRTPGDDEALGLGFLLCERVIRSLDDVISVQHCTVVPHPDAEENVLQVRVRGEVDLERLRRHTFASSSCGVCGKATIDNACAVAAPLDPASDGARIALGTLLALPRTLRDRQPGFDDTGGLHAAGLFTLDDGAPLCVFEDVGRHNAVDKAVGHALQARLPLGRTALFVSGRVSFEIVQKACAARVPILAGVSAPTSMAVRMADALGVTLAAFVRGDAATLYAHAGRIVP